MLKNTDHIYRRDSRVFLRLYCIVVHDKYGPCFLSIPRTSGRDGVVNIAPDEHIYLDHFKACPFKVV